MRAAALAPAVNCTYTPTATLSGEQYNFSTEGPLPRVAATAFRPGTFVPELPCMLAPDETVTVPKNLRHD
jgi:hypothetical protein